MAPKKRRAIVISVCIYIIFIYFNGICAAASHQFAWNVSVLGTEFPRGVATYSSGNIYVAGRTSDYGAGGTDVWIFKLGSDGNLVWNVTYGGAFSDEGHDVATDTSGNVYVTGIYFTLDAENGLYTFQDLLLIKYDSLGNLLWSRILNGSNYDSGNAVDTDSSGNIYVAGTTQSFGAGSNDLFVLKYNMSGDLLWNRTFGGPDSDEGFALAVDSSGNVYAGGRNSSLNGLLVKYDSEGNLQWNKSLPCDSLISVDVDSYGAIYGASTYNDELYEVMKCDSDGNLLWNRTFGLEDGIYTATGITMDPNDNFYMTGDINLPIPGDEYNNSILVISGDSDGNILWNKTYGSAISDTFESYGIVSDPLGNIYIILANIFGDDVIKYAIEAAPGGQFPNSSGFDIGSGSTNFSAVPDLSSVSGLALAKSGSGKIEFPSGYAVNAVGQDYDSHVHMGSGFVSVNTGALHQSFNSSANITLEGVDCSGYLIYYSEGTYLSANEIKAFGQLCPGSICQDHSCVGTTLTFTVSHFTGYAAGDSTNLTIYDELEVSGERYSGQAITFYANYTNISSGAHVPGASCSIYFDDGSGPSAMADNGNNYNYTKLAGFSSAGLHDWNVTCSKAGFNTLSANDTVLVTSSIPEFSCATLVLALLVVILILIRTRKHSQDQFRDVKCK